MTHPAERWPNRVNPGRKKPCLSSGLSGVRRRAVTPFSGAFEGCGAPRSSPEMNTGRDDPLYRNPVVWEAWLSPKSPLSGGTASSVTRAFGMRS